MAITKERLEELINKGATVYTILQGGIEKVDLAKARIFGRTNNYTFIDYWCDTFDQYIETSNERLYETQKEAEWSLKYQHIPRTEELNLPMWEEPKADQITTFMCKDHREARLYVSKFYNCVCVEIGDWTEFREEYSKENYIKACDLCIKLFKGEEDDK